MSTEPNWPEGYDRIVLETCDSTNGEAVRLARELKRPTWILARRQTGGRGRQGRRWASPEGNFTATLLMRPTGTAGWAALRSFMAANAVFEALALHVHRSRLAMKWPNDVLLDNGKVAGLLLESASRGDQIDWLAIGIGVNLSHTPGGIRDAAFPPTAVGEDVDVELFLTELAGFYATQEDMLTQLGFDTIRESWLRHAARLGEVITARLPQEEITGRFESVDEAGRLVLSTPDGERRISAADIFF
ncbi:BirA family transcriptional regulator, biotin operon repressor / biotin-[acetyl-CoA-carboxylase] ligase [Palleronia marisminoris]|uniref:biotin--[biotin carboxyl-carrier protein] ligase n=1 Tax=Palleronia marisminoris TaxID=315423 RepID=A0A1Y5TGB0_9RHOB|nr:biotin--[acetyl-CoA-carboxylase] ligase [Palleronia marisminoris]SFH34790.1 BirA family transcriptional regulator, biotin operon repressor / biotin-[acetyl-CoA-carboxylase] ligase [Palleronia marisminoris]SLN59734.1 Bifunctional ligase/repressor BirA [Palleronia marisminoris]